MDSFIRKSFLSLLLLCRLADPYMEPFLVLLLSMALLISLVTLSLFFLLFSPSVFF